MRTSERACGGAHERRACGAGETGGSAVACATCNEAFLIRPARGIVPRWSEVTYVARLKSILAQVHTDKRKHRRASDLGA